MNRLLLLPLLVACHGATPADSKVAIPGTRVAGTTEREAAPSTADLPTLSAENADFSFDLLRTVYAQDPGNQVLSPWSLQIVMAQVHAGATGDARAAIATTFGWSLADDAIDTAFDAADLSVAAHDDADADPPVVVTSTNQIFVTDGYELGASWLDTLSGWYGTGVQQMDFEGDPDGVADAINTWIADRTGGHIKDLVSGSLVASSRMLLANALYFEASWEVPFAESTTTDRSFTLADGSAVSVPTMSGSVTVSGAQADGFFAADLPYADAGTGLTMTIVLPDEGRFDDVLAGLDWPTLSAAIDAEASCDECEVQLPKFEMEGKPDITSALTTLGMAPAFGGTYDDISPSLTLTAVEQQGFVSVSEKGTEAAAATVAVFDESASEPPFGPIVIDRPFLWLIRESDGGAVLFAGVVTDPR